MKKNQQNNECIKIKINKWIIDKMKYKINISCIVVWSISEQNLNKKLMFDP